MASLAGSAWAQGGTGLRGAYYAYPQASSPDRAEVFTDANLKLVRLDPTVNFGFSAPPGPGVPGDGFAVQWSGQVLALFSEDTTFCAAADDGVRLWVSANPIDPAKDTPIVDQWIDQGETEWCADSPIKLTARTKYNIVMEQYENGGGEAARLRWSSASIPKQIIPASQLFPPPADDKTAPGGITDLTAANATSTCVDLSWTAPGDDGNTGTVFSYDIRYSLGPITAANVGSATTASSVPTPEKAGTKQTVTVCGLDPLQKYNLAVQANDEALNGALSNNVTAQTLPGSGVAVVDYWFNIGGTTLDALQSDQRFIDNKPDQTTYLYAADMPADKYDNYGARLSTLFIPPVTADYTFYISSDDQGSLSLSTDETVAKLTEIATVQSWSSTHQWDKEDNQKSEPIHLEQGKRYLIQGLVKEGGGGNNLGVRVDYQDGGQDISLAPIPGNLLALPAGFTPPPAGRLSGQVTDSNNNNAVVAGALITLTSGGKTWNTNTDGAGGYGILVPPGTYEVMASGPNGDNAFNAATSTKATGTVEADKVASLNFTISLPKLNNPLNATMDLQAPALADAKLSGWALLHMTADESLQFGGPNSPDPAFLAAACDPNLSTTGKSTIVPNEEWLQDWDLVPGDAGGPGRNGDPNGIPDNSYWLEALHLKVTGDVAKGTQFRITDFNMDDWFIQACVNGVLVGGNRDGIWSSNRAYWIPPGVLKTDGSDNLIVHVGQEGGGGAGHNQPFTGPTLVAYGPDTGGPSCSEVNGDLNGDGKVNVQDATLSLNIAVSVTTPNDCQKTAGDYNQDGKLNIQDTTLILNKAVSG